VSDPKRLGADGGLGATLLDSARADGPSRAARQRAAVALGFGLATAAATTTVAGGASAGAAGGTAGATAKVAGVSLWVKVVAGGIAVATVSGGTIAVTTSRSSPLETPAVVAPAPPKAAPKVVVPAPVPTTVTEPAPVETSPPAPKVEATPPKTHPAAAAPSADSPLSRELKSLDGARAYLDRGDPSGALSALDRHDRAFSHGSLRTESAVLRAEALLARGDTAAAKKLARDVLARDPSGPHAKRLRSIAETP
jgi:hypothetical protein